MSASYLIGGVEPSRSLHPTPWTWTDRFTTQSAESWRSSIYSRQDEEPQPTKTGAPAAANGLPDQRRLLAVCECINIWMSMAIPTVTSGLPCPASVSPTDGVWTDCTVAQNLINCSAYENSFGEVSAIFSPPPLLPLHIVTYNCIPLQNICLPWREEVMTTARSLESSNQA